MMTKHDIRVVRRNMRRVCSVVTVITAISSALLLSQITVPVMAEDLCREKGITVRNATMIDLWYIKDGGDCTIWIHDHRFTIKQGERVNIYSDMNCQTLYCTPSPTYKGYQSIDTNGDCFVNVFPNCSSSRK